MSDPLGTLTDTIAKLECREVSARELLDAQLERIDRLDGPVNAVVTIDAERAYEEADAVDKARVEGTENRPLAGVSITIKDALAVAGIRSTGGAAELADNVPDVDAVAVSRLRAAGANIFAKTNVPRWSGDVQTHNEMFGVTNNPWNTDHTPGGSSGGAATSVAMGFSPFEVGTDIGGSVRIPASNCGVYGHKPSYGIISTHGYLDNVEQSIVDADVNVFGPFARSIDDLELVFDLLVAPGTDMSAAWSIDLPPARAADLADFRIAAWIDDDFCPVSEGVRSVLGSLVDRIEAAGASVDRISRPRFDAANASLQGLRLISAATDISSTVEEWDAKNDAGVALSHREWDLMHRERAHIRSLWAEFFEDFDVLLCPVAPVEPIRHTHSPLGSNFLHSVLSDHGDRPYSDLVGWTTLIGSAYLPVTVPPVGRTTDGLPVGVQVVAPFLHDRTSIAFSRAIAEVVGGYEPPPMAV
ncbi:MAG: amidase [Actinomycetia bacterium]|nr:amidase [Actinomycetes bacterium]MCP4960596.1 amidase [Actinomycetes bacterium]